MGSKKPKPGKAFAGKHVPTSNVKATRLPGKQKQQQAAAAAGGGGGGGKRKKDRSFWGLMAAGAGFAGEAMP